MTTTAPATPTPAHAPAHAPTHAPTHAHADPLDAAKARFRDVAARKLHDLADTMERGGALMAGYRSASFSGPAGSYAMTMSGARLARQEAPARAFLTPGVATDLRARCGLLRRNNAIARAMVRALATHIQGDGYPFEVKSSSKEFNAEAGKILRDLVVERGLVEAGNACVWSGGFEGDRLIVKVEGGYLQHIEAGRIKTPGAAVTPQHDTTTITTTERGTMIMDGVEVDAIGRPVAFHVGKWRDEAQAARAAAKRTPGSFKAAGSAAGLTDFEVVSAADAIFMRWPIGHDPSRVRGEPALQASLDRFLLIDRLCDNAAVASAMAASIGLIIKSANPTERLTGMLEELEGTAAAAALNATSTAQPPPAVNFGPGFVYHTRPGEEAEPFAPTWPEVDIRQFVTMQLQLIAADLGLPLMLAINDMTGLTASNAKMILQMAYRGFDVVQAWLIDQLWTPVLRWWLALEIRAGRLPLVEGWDRVVVNPRYAPIIDMRGEFEALHFGVRNNLITHQSAISQISGDSFDELIATREVERATESAAGVAPLAAPGAKPIDAQP